MPVKHLKVSAKPDTADPSIIQASDWNALHDLSAFVASDVSDFAEAVDDRVALLLKQGSNVTLSYDDTANSLTISSSGGNKTTIDDTAPPTPAYGDRWIKPSNMTEMVWVPNAGTPGVWINPADATSQAYPIGINKGGTGAVTAAAARVNLGIDAATGERLIPDGVVALPGLAWASEPGLGFYREGAGKFATAAGGVKVLGVDASTAALSLLSLWPRTASEADLLIHDSPPSAANYQRIQLGCSAGGGFLYAQGYGTKPKPGLTFDAALFTFSGGNVIAPRYTITGQSAFGFYPGGSGQIFAFDSTHYLDIGGGYLRWFGGTANRMTLADSGDVTFAKDVYAGGNLGLLNSNGANPYVRFTSDGWKLIYSAGTLIWQNPSGTNLCTIGANGAYGDNISGGGWSFQTMKSGGIQFSTTSSTLIEVAIGNPAIGVNYEYQFYHSPGISAGCRMTVGGGMNYEFRNDGSAWSVGGWQTFSDARLKENVKPIDNAMERLRMITGCTFDRLDAKNYDGSVMRQAGVIYQDVYRALPEATKIDNEPGAMGSVNDMGVLALIANAVKELDTRIAQLEQP